MKLIFLSAIVLSIQPVFSFCVYNNLENGLLKIENQSDIVLPERWFRATLKPGEKQCCHYSNLDCSPMGSNTLPIKFKATIYFEGSGAGIDKTVTCTTGGGLEFHGIQESIGATCTQANGIVKQL